MKIVTPDQMREIDNLAINLIGIPSIVLMENAAIKVKEESEKLLNGLKNKKVFVFAGKGNNGGDALAVARLMHNCGTIVEVFVFDDTFTAEAKINFEIIKKMGLEINSISNEDYLSKVKIDLERVDLVIDGIFGTGIKGIVSGIINKTIRIINESNKKVISIDIPSGVNGGTGEIAGICINATKTVSLALPKIGFYKNPGNAYLGELTVADISIPKIVIDRFTLNLNLITKEKIMEIFPKRYKDSNKGTYGRLFLITGSLGMTGAGTLAGKSAYRTGAGLVYLGVPASLINIYESMLAESVTLPFKDGGGYFHPDSYTQIVEFSKSVDVVGIGPGLSNRDELIEFVEKLIENIDKPMVLDADALNLISKKINILEKLKAKTIITPHPGEMARLTGKSILEIQNDRIGISLEFSKKWNIIVVLKGNNTVITMPNGEIYINETGNNGMATAGSGDVLTGIIMSLIGQGKRPEEAAIIGTYIHGLAGDIASKELTEYSTVSNDIIGKIPKAIKALFSLNY